MKRMSAAEVLSADHEVAASRPASRKVMARYPIATVGSCTIRGGRIVVAEHELHLDGFRVACVGDRVRYPDGSESIIVSGAGNASTFDDRPIALVGSHVENGDRIASSQQNMGEIVLFEGDAPITGLLQPGYMPPRASSGA
ncbi:PAAR domain-containing protein [Massilia consociata]|uniref:PAAR domain-containing protein n=1 Tax=Massilia consociata TaxID=760117 RepID=A0ABV6FI67_9BURK